MAKLTVTGVGVATADSELKFVGDNKSAVCSVNLAFNRSYKKDGKDSEWQKEACFVRAQVWGARAERMAELAKKGQPMYITGYLKQDSWEDPEGNKRVAFTIALRDFQLCEKHTKNGNESKPQAEPVASAATSSSDNDIPF